jgi:hypothetical protein
VRTLVRFIRWALCSVRMDCLVDALRMKGGGDTMKEGGIGFALRGIIVELHETVSIDSTCSLYTSEDDMLGPHLSEG